MAETHVHSVIIVEDSQDTRDSLALLLELNGHHAVCVSNGREALDLIHSGKVRPCAVLLDLVMPAMDGLAFLEHLQRSVHAATPVVVFTGHEGFRKEALAKGCAAALLKPAKPEELLRIVEHHCPPGADRAQKA
jgi:CheY-like chemotaxis protein